LRNDQNENKKKQIDDVESVLEIVDEAYKDIHELIGTVDNPKP
jgi:archaellum component FlaC